MMLLAASLGAQTPSEGDILPGDLVGGPVTATVSASEGPAIWIMPGLRELDPEVFGTPGNPLGFEPGVGVPLDERLVSDDGSEYTTTSEPTPFSDNFQYVSGSFELEVTDATLMDSPDSDDGASFAATFTGPDGRERTVELLHLLPVGREHTFFGGVATNVIIHGQTGIGSKLMPMVPTYVAFWGVGELSVEGEVVASNRVIHGMLTADVRNDDYQLVFNDGVEDEGMHFHLLLPNVEVTTGGPRRSSLPSRHMLEENREQPFIHLMFEDVTVTSPEDG